MENNLLQKPLSDLYRNLHQIVIDERAVSFASGALTDSPGNNDNRPLLDIYPPIVDPEYFFTVAGQVAGILNQHFPGQENELAQILSAWPKDPERRNELTAKMFIPGTDLTTCFERELPAEALGLLFSYTVQLFMRQYVIKALPFRDLDKWHKGVCPVCGEKPNLALLDKINKGKYLHCGYCGVKWRFQRLSCPFCYSYESQYLFFEGEKKYRIYVCDQCGGYIKTIDCEHAGKEELDLLMEDIKTIHMDLLALKEGYHK